MVPLPWFRDAVVYQVYPRSFADSDGDGMGDLRGIASRIDYFRELGIDAIWLSPFYPSALADGGYDVDDYFEVDPRLGTLTDFDELVAALHAAGIRLVIDLAPNHTSDRHEWFRSALAAGPGSAERERYIFRQGAEGEPPNDWQSGFGGGAWEPIGDEWWYFHIFAKEQPDLNWDNQEVREYFIDVLRFWLDRGVDGFRVDVAHGLMKDWSAIDRPWHEVGFLTTEGHPFWDVPGVLDIYSGWRDVLGEYSPPRFAVAEASVFGERRAAYAGALGQAFNFQMQDADWTPASYRAAIDEGLRDLQLTGSTTWLLGCHDAPRVATRFGLPRQDETPRAAREWLLTNGTVPQVDVELGRRRAEAAALALMALPGSLYIYQGDELGLPEVADLPEEALQDPIAVRNRGVEKGRDGCRVPLPWTATGPSLGFGSAGAHLPQPEWFADYAAATQNRDPYSTLGRYQCGLANRKLIDQTSSFEWLDAPLGVLRFARGGLECVVCFDGTYRIDADRVVLASSPVSDEAGPDQTVWLTRG